MSAGGDILHKFFDTTADGGSKPSGLVDRRLCASGFVLAPPILSDAGTGGGFHLRHLESQPGELEIDGESAWLIEAHDFIVFPAKCGSSESQKLSKNTHLDTWYSVQNRVPTIVIVFGATCCGLSLYVIGNSPSLFAGGILLTNPQSGVKYFCWVSEADRKWQILAGRAAPPAASSDNICYKTGHFQALMKTVTFVFVNNRPIFCGQVYHEYRYQAIQYRYLSSAVVVCGIDKRNNSSAMKTRENAKILTHPTIEHRTTARRPASRLHVLADVVRRCRRANFEITGKAQEIGL